MPDRDFEPGDRVEVDIAGQAFLATVRHSPTPELVHVDLDAYSIDSVRVVGPDQIRRVNREPVA